jgi:hypothetical protein
LDLVCIFEIFYRQIWCSPHAHEQWHLWRQFIRDFAFTSEFLAGKFVMFGEDKKALVYFVSSKGIFVHKYPFILRSNDWLVLEIQLNGQGKRFCGKERNTCKFILTLWCLYLLWKTAGNFATSLYWKFDDG